jgi:hypothetical protein
MNAQGRDFHFALESLAQVLNSLVSDVWLKPMGEYGCGDEDAGNPGQYDESERNEPLLSSARHYRVPSAPIKKACLSPLSHEVKV